MNKETDQFVISNVQAIVSPSNERSLNPRPPTKTGVRSAEAECKACGHVWKARFRDGSLDNVFGGALFSCPSCRTSEMITGLLC